MCVCVCVKESVCVRACVCVCVRVCETLTVEEHAGVVDSESVGGDTRVVSVIILCDVSDRQLRARAADLNTDALRAGQSDKHKH